MRCIYLFFSLLSLQIRIVSHLTIALGNLSEICWFRSLMFHLHWIARPKKLYFSAVSNLRHDWSLMNNIWEQMKEIEYRLTSVSLSAVRAVVTVSCESPYSSCTVRKDFTHSWRMEQAGDSYVEREPLLVGLVWFGHYGGWSTKSKVWVRVGVGKFTTYEEESRRRLAVRFSHTNCWGDIFSITFTVWPGDGWCSSSRNGSLPVRQRMRNIPHHAPAVLTSFSLPRSLTYH